MVSIERATSAYCSQMRDLDVTSVSAVPFSHIIDLSLEQHSGSQEHTENRLRVAAICSTESQTQIECSEKPSGALHLANVDTVNGIVEPSTPTVQENSGITTPSTDDAEDALDIAWD